MHKRGKARRLAIHLSSTFPSVRKSCPHKAKEMTAEDTEVHRGKEREREKEVRTRQ